MSNFFALLLRMRLINRWGMMRCAFSDNLAEHSFDTAVIAHCLCTIGNTLYGRQLDADRCAVLALYHDATEILTGDMPTPIKYYSPELRALYQEVEDEAAAQLTCSLPAELQEVYGPMLMGESGELRPYLKAADRLAALIKCMQEEQSGSREFSHARIQQQDALEESGLPEVTYFMEKFLPAFSLGLDQQLAAIGGQPGGRAAGKEQHHGLE